MSADSLEITVEVEPPDVSVASYGGLGYGAVTVRARNPAAHDVIVTLGPPQIDPHRATFGFRVDGGSSAILGFAYLFDTAQTHFRAGETKRQVFDFFLRLLKSAPPGDYQAFGDFGGHAANPTTFRVFP